MINLENWEGWWREKRIYRERGWVEVGIKKNDVELIAFIKNYN